MCSRTGPAIGRLRRRVSRWHPRRRGLWHLRFVTFPALVVRVLVASPGDTAMERAQIEQVIRDWNAARAVAAEVVLMPVMWETHAVPELGADAQAVINAQVGDSCDIVVAVFNNRLGTGTSRAISGTVEEIERAQGAGRPVHVWFSGAPIARDADLDQVAALRAFRDRLNGLYGEYNDLPDLAFKVRQALERDINVLAESEKRDLPRLVQRQGRATAPMPSAEAPKARLRAHASRQGRGTISVRIANTGSAAANDLSVTFVSSSGKELQAHGPQHFDLLDGADATWQLWLSLADSAPEVVGMTWIEDGVSRSLKQTVSI